MSLYSEIVSTNSVASSMKSSSTKRKQFVSNGTTITYDMELRMIHAYKARMNSVREISDFFNITPGTFYNVLSRHNVKRLGQLKK